MNAKKMMTYAAIGGVVAVALGGAFRIAAIQQENLEACQAFAEEHMDTIIAEAGTDIVGRYVFKTPEGKICEVYPEIGN